MAELFKKFQLVEIIIILKIIFTIFKTFKIKLAFYNDIQNYMHMCTTTLIQGQKYELNLLCHQIC